MIFLLPYRENMVIKKKKLEIPETQAFIYEVLLMYFSDCVTDHCELWFVFLINEIDFSFTWIYDYLTFSVS